MSSLQTKTFEFTEVKAEGTGDGSRFSGYCAAFNNVDAYGDVITPDAFGSTLDDFVKQGQICYEHGEVIGKPTTARADPKGLFIEGQISDTARGRDAKTLLKDGVFRKMSIGYRTPAKGRVPTNADQIKSYWASAGYTPTSEDLANLEQNASNLAFLKSIKLYEASPVGFPANTQADITDVKDLLGLDQVLGLARDLRTEVKSGRQLSSKSRERLKAIHEHMKPACDQLKALLDETDPDTGQVGTDTDELPGDVDDAAAKSKTQKADLVKARNQLTLLSVDPMFSHLDQVK